MSKPEECRGKLDAATKRWWFFLLYILLQFIPPYTSKGYEPSETSFIISHILANSFMFSCVQVYPIFKVAPILLIVSLLLLKNRVRRLFSLYAGVTYVLFAFLQSIAVTESYGIGVIMANLIMFLIVAAFWLWESVARENDFTARNQSLWRLCFISLAALAFWFPLNPDTLTPDFNPAYIFTNSAGLAFCMMTPVYLTILILYHPRINMAVLRVTSLTGILIGFYNMLHFLNPTGWWLGVLHIPLLATSLYGFILSFR